MGITRQPHPQQKQRLNPLSRLKVHLRLLPLAGRTYRIITLRPSTRVAFSTNYYHDTWHLLSDMTGSQLLARLLWGLSYQRQPGTMALIHDRHLLPTPFEAERSDPFLLIPSHLTAVDPKAFRTLRSRLLHLGQPSHTARWLTFGLDAAWKAWQRDGQHQPQEQEWDRLWHEDHEKRWRQERMGRCGGFIYYAAPPPILHGSGEKLQSFPTMLTAKPGR